MSKQIKIDKNSPTDPIQFNQLVIQPSFPQMEVGGVIFLPFPIFISSSSILTLVDAFTQSIVHI